jgi:AmmeMemoRadiSam system protein A
VIVSPHATAYADYFHISPNESLEGSLSQFGSYEKISVRCDTEFVKELAKNAESTGLSAGTSGNNSPLLDHGTFIPLYFINKYYKQYKLVRIGISGLPDLEHYHLGKLAAQTAEILSKRVLFVASGDLSHHLKDDGPYHFMPEGPKFDKDITEALSDGDFLKVLKMNEEFCSKAGECGRRPIIVTAGALDGKKVTSRLLSYESTFGVGYAVCIFDVTGTDNSRHFDKILISDFKKSTPGFDSDPYIRLAKDAVYEYVNTGKTLKINNNSLPQEMLNTKRGVFVSVKKMGALRGCIGTIYPAEKNTATEIIRNAINAVSNDPRFPPVKPNELELLTFSVDLLMPPEPATITNLDPKRYGVIVSNGRGRGLLLPNLNGVDTVEQQLEIALNKAGIEKFSSYSIERFEVERHAADNEGE